jgi:hypothetical protein
MSLACRHPPSLCVGRFQLKCRNDGGPKLFLAAAEGLTYLELCCVATQRLARAVSWKSLAFGIFFDSRMISIANWFAGRVRRHLK